MFTYDLVEELSDHPVGVRLFHIDFIWSFLESDTDWSGIDHITTLDITVLSFSEYVLYTIATGIKCGSVICFVFVSERILFCLIQSEVIEAFQTSSGSLPFTAY
ncbi:MAG: hypothetical protein ACQESG_01645 [Nanobdellota archaeon]